VKPGRDADGVAKTQTTIRQTLADTLVYLCVRHPSIAYCLVHEPMQIGGHKCRGANIGYKNVLKQ
jgi:hypothetical protein